MERRIYYGNNANQGLSVKEHLENRHYVQYRNYKKKKNMQRRLRVFEEILRKADKVEKRCIEAPKCM